MNDSTTKNTVIRSATKPILYPAYGPWNQHTNLWSNPLEAMRWT